MANLNPFAQTVLEGILGLGKKGDPIESPFDDFGMTASFHLLEVLGTPGLSDQERYALFATVVFLREGMIPPEWAIRESLDILKRLEGGKGA